MEDSIFDVQFDLDISDSYIEIYDLKDGDSSFLSAELELRLSFFDGQLYAKNFLISEASLGMYKVETTFYNFREKPYSKNQLKKKIEKAINDKDHACQVLKVE